MTAFKKAAGAAAGEPVEDEEPAEVRVELPVDASIPHEYVPSERLRLDAYRKIAAATSEAEIDAVRAELVDRYGPLPDQLENLLAVAAFRQTCRAAGITEVALGPQGLRFTPVELPESGQLRMARVLSRFEVPGVDPHPDPPAAHRRRPDRRAAHPGPRAARLLPISPCRPPRPGFRLNLPPSGADGPMGVSTTDALLAWIKVDLPP